MNRTERLFVEPDQPEDEFTSLNDRKTFDDALAVDDRKTFDALAIAARELEESDFSQFEAAFAQASIFEKLDALQEPEDLSVDAIEDTVGVRRKLRGRSVLALVAAAALVGYITLPIQSPPDEYQARSSTTVDRTPKPSVHVFCVHRQADELRFIGAAESPFGVVRCASEDDLKIAYENPDAQLRYVYLAGLGTDGEVRWYGPTPTQPEVLGVHVTSKPTPIGQTRTLSINHPPGTYDVFALFTPQPVALKDFEAEMKRIAHGGAATGQVIVRTTFEVRP
ncbi:MAG: hypothetical protein R3E66_00805 [bacterium]